MNEPKTPNLGLNKIDRSSPSTTYFDLDKYLDQNWEKVDRFAEQVEEKSEEIAGQVSSIRERLDTEQRKSVTLEPGLQIVHAESTSAFKLEGLKGRTLVNLLGRIGRFSNLSNVVSNGNHSISVSAGHKIDGDNALTITNTGKGGVQDLVRVTDFTFENDAFYIGIMNAKADVSTLLHSELFGTRGSVLGQEVTTEWKTLVFRYLGTSGGVGLHFWNDNAAANTIYINGLRLFKVKSAEYIAPDADLIAKYPYVDSVQPVRNPYAIRYGENLAPPFYEWAHSAPRHSMEKSPYELEMTVTDANEACVSYIELSVTPNTDYTYSAKHTGHLSVTTRTGDILVDNTTAQSITFNTGNREKIIINVYNNRLTGTFNFKNPMLALGNVAKPFKPREDAMLALQTDLYAEPLTGTNADEVFEKDGQYFKLAKWKKVTIEGSKILNNPIISSKTGYKTIYPKLEGANYGFTGIGTAVKYDGKLLTWGSHEEMADGWAIDGNNNNFAVSVSNADSGWGDSYTDLTADEIKAYFMGWKMYTFAQPVDGSYDGTGTKAWVEITWKDKNNDANIGQHVTYTLPTAQAPNYTPYQLIYQLATPTVEPITSEGQLTLIEGNNQVEVGTGIVLRESVKPYVNAGIGYAGINAPSSPNYPGTGLQTKVSKLLKIYKDGRIDNGWKIQPGQVGGGTEYADILIANYDSSASYSATYLMLDKSPIAPIVGSVAENEKALLTDLVQDVQQANARLSVVENKKAEKDSPSPLWITPTLLNGWVNYGTGSYGSARYYKDSFGRVYFDGLIKSGIVGSTGVAFKLPKGYIPAKTFLSLVQSGDGNSQIYGRVDVKNTGEVVIATGGNGWISLADISFLAEQ